MYTEHPCRKNQLGDCAIAEAPADFPDSGVAGVVPFPRQGGARGRRMLDSWNQTSGLT